MATAPRRRGGSSRRGAVGLASTRPRGGATARCALSRTAPAAGGRARRLRVPADQGASGMKREAQFTNIHTEGGLLPADMLVRVASLDRDLEAVSAEDYHLAPSERITEAIDRSWNRLVGAWEAFTQTLGGLASDDRTATEPTRRRWSLVLFQELGYGQLQVA